MLTHLQGFKFSDLVWRSQETVSECVSVLKFFVSFFSCVVIAPLSPTLAPRGGGLEPEARGGGRLQQRIHPASRFRRAKFY